MFEPGSAWTYGTGLGWVGQLVEAVSGERFDAYLDRHVFAPLGMTRTSFASGASRGLPQAAMHARQADEGLAPIDFAMPPPPYPSMGGGGLYSTAGDFLKFLEAILDRGGPILKPQTVAAMAGSQWEGLEVGVLPGVSGQQLCGHFDPFPGATKQWGLGFVINPAAGPNGRSPGSLAWAGLANCYYWVDPKARVAGAMLAQVLPFGDERLLTAFGQFERAAYGRAA